jgi:hypothetical protein
VSAGGYPVTEHSTSEFSSTNGLKDSSMNESINYVSSFYNSRPTEQRPLRRPVRLLLRLFVVTGTCLPNRCQAMDYSASVRCVNVCSFRSNRVLPSRCLSNGRLFWLHYSDFQPSCHNMKYEKFCSQLSICFKRHVGYRNTRIFRMCWGQLERLKPCKIGLSWVKETLDFSSLSFRSF